VGHVPTPPPGPGGWTIDTHTPAALQILGVHKTFGPLVAVDGIDLAVRPGEVHGLLGPNGAGKTTLLSMVFGLTVPDSGSIDVSGAPVGSAAAARTTAGFLEPAFWPYLSGRANLQALGRLDGGAPKDRVEAELRRVGLTDRADTRVGGWSLGMRQRLAIASAMLRDPQLMVLDEPTNGLDPESLQRFRDIVRGLAADGVAVLLSSHAIAEVAALADRVTIVAAGRVAFTGSVDELVSSAPDPQHLLHTSDDPAAHAVAARFPGVRVDVAAGSHLVVTAGQQQLDRLVLELARAGIAVRHLDIAVDPLESLFFRLTERTAP